MKTVVSYFHELAGHDRFMDVEPQAPDMETLALLTAEQAGTDVEIAGEGQNVSLRAAPEEDELAADDETEAFAEDEEFGVKEDARSAILSVGDSRGLQVIEEIEQDGYF